MRPGEREPRLLTRDLFFMDEEQIAADEKAKGPGMAGAFFLVLHKSLFTTHESRS